MDHLVPGVMFFLTIAYIRSLPIINSPLDKKVLCIVNIDFFTYLEHVRLLHQNGKVLN